MYEWQFNKEIAGVYQDTAISILPVYTAPPQRTEQNFCPRCGKRTNDIHTCTPPQRTWVGLTDEEIELIYGVIIKIRKKDIMPVEQKQFAKTLELLLRKKNT
jgi:hypothetical protein